jgi:hypothetical protein
MSPWTVPTSLAEVKRSWLSDQGQANKHMILTLGARPGYCYLRMLFFVKEFAFLEQEKLSVALADFSLLGPDPLGSEIIIELFMVMWRVHPEGFPGIDIAGNLTSEQGILQVYEVLKDTKARMSVSEVEGKLHLLEPVWCGCQGPICLHGWDFRMISTVLMRPGKVCGASNFNLEEFLSGGINMESNENFEDVYSCLDVPQEEVEASKKRVNNWQDRDLSSGDKPSGMVSQQEIKDVALKFLERSDKKNGTTLAVDLKNAKESAFGPPAPPPLPTPTKIVPRRMRPADKKAPNVPQEASPVVNPSFGPVLEQILEAMSVFKATGEQINSRIDKLEASSEVTVSKTQQPLSPPPSPETQKANTIREGTIGPLDSSSVLGRYDRSYMKDGTVFTASAAGCTADAADNRTNLTVGTYLVEGFKRDDESQRKELKSIGRIKPINGLPRPFQSMRLNFLANFHTGLGRACSKYEGLAMEDVVYKVMGYEPRLPVDELLQQVLRSSLDGRMCEYIANPFSLPYIEIGMLITEESLCKMLDSIQGEYKALWFQELKAIHVPNFHSDFRRFSSEPSSGTRRTKSRRQSSDTQSTVGSKPSKQRTFLGL